MGDRLAVHRDETEFFAGSPDPEKLAGRRESACRERIDSIRLIRHFYRKGLDEMANNVERGRTEITTTLTENLKKAHSDKPLSLLPQIWLDYKKEELASIYKGKGTQKEKEALHDLLMSINASQSATWDKILQ